MASQSGAAAASGLRCMQCGSQRFRQHEETGAMVCLVCDMQSQDYRDEDLDIEDVRGGLFRYRTGGQALREEKRQRTRELMRLLRRRDPAPPHVYLAVMQDILLLQAHALCAYLGVSQELFLATLKPIWAAVVARILSLSPDERRVCLTHKVNYTHYQLTRNPLLQVTIAVLLLCSRRLSLPVCSADLVNMCANGHLPYLGALYHLPTSAYERVNLQQRKQLSTSVVPTAHVLDNSVNLYARQILGWESLPPPNIIGLIRNFCRRMDLPPAARVVAERLSELMPVRTAVSTSEMYLNQQSLTRPALVYSTPHLDAMAWVILAARLTMDGLDGSPVEESGAEAHHGVSPHRAAADYYIPGCDTAAAALERWQRAEREGFALLQQQQQEEEKEMEGEEEQQQQQEDDAVELQSSQPGGGGSDTGLSRLLGTLTKLQWLLRRQSGHQLTEEVEDKLVQALVAADAVVNTVTWPEWMQHHRSLVDKYTGVRSFTDTEDLEEIKELLQPQLVDNAKSTKYYFLMLSEKLENMADALEEERYATAAAAASSASRSFVAQAGAPSAKRTLRRDLITVPSITARAKKYKVFQKPDPRFIRDAIPTSYLCLLKMATSVAQCCIEELFYCVMMREKFLLQLRDGQQDAPPPQIGVDGICPHCLAWERTYTARRKHRCKAARALGLRPLGLKAPAEIQPNAAADASDGAAEDENDSASENDDDNDGAATETTAKTRRKPRVDPEVVLEDIVNSDMLPTIAVWRRLCDRFF